MTTTTKLTAEEYRNSLPRACNGAAWTIETFSVYVKLKFPNVSVADGQVWTKTSDKYKFICQHHGVYVTQAKSVLESKKGCGCKDCMVDSKKTSAGTMRSPRATQEEKDLAAKLRADGLSYREIGNRLGGRSMSTIRCWLNPDALAKNRQDSKNWRSNNPDQHLANVRRWITKFDHGKASSRSACANRRFLKSNTPTCVFIDNEWHEVDRKETYSVFKDVLLPPYERKAIQELYLEAQYLTETTGVEHHVDHLQPLSKGGEHRLINLQILSADENMSKHNKFRKEDQELLCKRLFNETW